jgi:hypothetical protein
MLGSITMYALAWIRQLQRRLSPPRAVRRVPVRRRVRHCLEILEDRIVPAIFNVAAGDVYGPNGLIAEINAANTNNDPNGNIINLAASTYNLTQINNFWYGPDGLPAIRSNLTINGNGATIQRDSGVPNFRLFYVSGGLSGPGLPAGNLTLKDLTLEGGVAQGGSSSRGGGGLGAGGAIFNQGTLNLNRVTLTNDTAAGGSSGVAGTGLGGGGMGQNAPTSGAGGGFGGNLGGTFGGNGGTGGPAVGGAGGGGGGGGFRLGDNGQNSSGSTGANGGGLGGFGGNGGGDVSGGGGGGRDGGGGGVGAPP